MRVDEHSYIFHIKLFQSHSGNLQAMQNFANYHESPKSYAENHGTWYNMRPKKYITLLLIWSG